MGPREVEATLSRVFGDQAPALCARLRDRTVAVKAQLSDHRGVRELVTRTDDGMEMTRSRSPLGYREGAAGDMMEDHERDGGGAKQGVLRTGRSRRRFFRSSMPGMAPPVALTPALPSPGGHPVGPSVEEWRTMTPEARERFLVEVNTALSNASLMSEGQPHKRAKSRAADMLGLHFKKMGRLVYVAEELSVVYPGEAAFSPDVLAVLGIEQPGDDPRMAWVVADEGKGLDFVLEVLDRGDRRKDLVENVERYARIGIPEDFRGPFGLINVSWGTGCLPRRPAATSESSLRGAGTPRPSSASIPPFRRAPFVSFREWRSSRSDDCTPAGSRAWWSPSRRRPTRRRPWRRARWRACARE